MQTKHPPAANTTIPSHLIMICETPLPPSLPRKSSSVNHKISKEELPILWVEPML